MKKIFCGLLLVLILFAGQITAQDKPLIFINTNSFAAGVITENTGASKFFSLARAAGFRINHGYHPTIDDETLENIDVYIWPVPMSFILDEEKAALRRCVRSGKVLIIMGWAIGGNEDSFIQEFGMQLMEFKTYNNYGYVPEESPLAGPNEIEKTFHVGYKRIQITNKTKARALGYTDSGVIHTAEAIGNTIGKGKILVCNSLGMFIDEYPWGGAITKADNINFIKNLLEYCKGSFDLAVTFARPKGKNLFPGDELTLIAKVKNLGDVNSTPTKLTFYLTDDGELEEDAAPAAVIKKMITIDVGTVLPKKQVKLSVKGKIPSWVAPGTYYLVAQVDPAESSNDTDKSNNIKVAKKKIVIN